MAIGKILIVNNVVCRPFTTGPVISPNGLTIQALLGVPSINIQSGGGGQSEPVFVQGANTSLVFDDFESYTNAQSFTAGGWTLASSFPQLTAPVGSGLAGGRSAQIIWGVSDNFVGLDHAVTGQVGRVSLVTWQYKAQNGFQFGGPNADQISKDLIILNQGLPQQVKIYITVVAGQPLLAMSMNQANGGAVAINTNGSVVPGFVNNAYHQFTLRLTSESGNLTGDGQIELWVDGVYTLNSGAGIFTSTSTATNIRVAGAFAGGSVQVQTEAFDRVRVWTPVPDPGTVPLPDPNNPDHIISLTENFAAYSTASQIGNLPRADGGDAWATTDVANQILRTDAANKHPFTGILGIPVGNTLEMNFAAAPPDSSSSVGHGLTIRGNNFPWLNATAANTKDCLVQYYIFRAKAGTGPSPFYDGKIFDWNIFLSGATFRYDIDGPCGCGFPMGYQRNLNPDTCSSDPLCGSVYNNCSSPKFSDVPPTCDAFTPSMNLEQTGGNNQTVFMRDNMGYVSGTAPHSWGAGGSNVNNQTWFMHVTRFTRGTAAGKGRVEQWMWPAGFTPVKTMDWNGADNAIGPHGETSQRGNVHVQPKDAGHPWLPDTGGGKGNVTGFQFFNHSATLGNFNGMGAGSYIQIGGLGMWYCSAT